MMNTYAAVFFYLLKYHAVFNAIIESIMLSSCCFLMQLLKNNCNLLKNNKNILTNNITTPYNTLRYQILLIRLKEMSLWIRKG